ncbi:DUF6010 family protein [Zavarzinia sp.]|uniref:DUF6010 family protein n=1 Tax=Zavarzinia sp. TaxID=2027920 RepID=UPI003BB5954C
MTIAATHKHHHGVFAPSMVGIGLSLATLPLHLLIAHEQSVELAAVMVAMIGAIYVGFAIQAGSVRQIAVESVVATLFMVAALAGLWLSPWVIPAAYVLHGLWDWLHHDRDHSADLVAPRGWYPPFCAAYDWVFAFGLAALWLA